MFDSRFCLWTGATLLTATMVPLAGIAAERGKFQGHAIFLDTKFHEVKTPEGHPYKAAWAGEQEGLIFHNGGGGALDRMLDRAHYIIQYVGDAGTESGYCMKTFTTKEGHKLYARCDWKLKAGGAGATGSVTLLGGTGPFSGIKGAGKFNHGRVTEKVSWDEIEWNWETP